MVAEKEKEMTNSRNLDLKPWAAYVVGHHPYRCRIEQERNWQKVVWHGETLDCRDWCDLETGVEQIDEALRVLAKGGQVDAAVLVELHRAKDAFVCICKDQQLSTPAHDLDASAPFGATEWFRMLDFSEHLLTSRDELQMWRQFGTEVGRAQFQLWEASPVGGDYRQLQERDIRLAEIAGRLTSEGRNAFLLRQASAEDNDGRPTQPVPTGRWTEMARSHLELARLDLQVRAILQQEAAPEPLLVLDAETLTFYGETKPFSECMPAEVACLWLLAENASKYVERSELTRVAGLASELHLKSHISRLRNKILKPLAEAGCGRSGAQLPPAYKEGFIKFSRGGEYDNGPYRLEIDPALVNIKAPRPSHMPRLTQPSAS
jgi:hypothetical protein